MGVRIFRGGTLDERFEGSVVVFGPRGSQMTGLVRGDLFVRDNSVCDVTGMVSGNLLAELKGKALVKGMVTKSCKAVGGDLEIYGLVLGDAVNEGGRMYIDKGAVVRGRIVGETSSAPLAAAAPAPAGTGTAPKPPAPPPATPPSA